MTVNTTGLHAQSKPLSQASSLDGRTFSGLTHESCFIPDWLPIDKDGYRIATNGSGGKSKAHRLSYRLLVGPIPGGYLVLHRCGNASCVNPLHLYLGDSLQNARDRDMHGMAYRGKGLPQTKLSDDQVREIRGSAKSCIELAKQYGITRSYVWCVKVGDARTNVPESNGVEA
jgi:hypothetical protein